MLSKSIWNSFPRLVGRNDNATIRNEQIWIANTQSTEQGREKRKGEKILRYIAWTQRCLITVKEGGSFRSRGRPYTPPLLRPNGPFYDGPRSRKKLTNTHHGVERPALSPRKSIPRDPLTKRYLGIGIEAISVFLERYRPDFRSPESEMIPCPNLAWPEFHPSSIP